MIPLTTIQTALAFSNARQLLFFPVKLLNLPAVATLLLSSYRRTLSQVIGYQPVRSVGRDRYPEQFHLNVKRKLMKFNQFTPRQLGQRPVQTAHRPVRLLAIAVIHFTIGFQGAVKHFVFADEQLHHVSGGIPTVHQHITE